MNPAPAPAACPACAAEVQPGSAFCSNCGTGLARTCSSCGAGLTPDARFCDRCGQAVTSAAPVAAAEVVQSTGQYSADGRWWWNGAQWVAVNQVAAAPAPVPFAPAVPKPRKAKRMVLRLTVAAVTFSLLTALAFVAISEVTSRAFLVNIFGVIAVLTTAWLLVLVVVRFTRGQRSKTWAGVMLGVLVLEAVLAGGLNVFADSRKTSTTALLQGYYAEVADAVSLGNAVAAGTAPAGVNFATVQAQADGVVSQLGTLDPPADLAGYRWSVYLWAANVSVAARFGSSLNPWQKQNVAYAADPFQLTMTTDQANAAVATSLHQIAILTTFAARARAVHNLEGIRYVGARLDAQAFWLEAVYTSADPGWVQAHLRFDEPIASYAVNAAAADLTPFAGAHRWPKPRSWPNCNPTGFAPCNVPRLQAPLGMLWKAAINPPPTYSTPTPDLVAAAKQFDTIPPIDTSGGQNLGGPGVGGYGQENVAPPAFAAKCKAEGGTIGDPVYDRTKSRVPTSEGGWTCRTPGNRCFDLLTFSGGEYRGGQSGCPEQGLRPAPLIPANGGGAKPVPTKAPSRGPSASTWDGTWTSAPTTVTCDVTGSLPDGTPVNQHLSQSGPSVTFVVSGDTVQGGGTHIPPGGQVSLSVPAGTATVVLSVTFVHDANGGAHYSGTINLDAVLIGDVKEHCSGAISGARN